MQDRQAEGRLAAWFDTPIARWIAGVVAALVIARVALMVAAMPDRESDFRVFHAAATLFLNGEAMVLFDPDAFALANRIEAEQMPWLYPPHVLLVLAPLALLAPGAAFAAMVATSFTALALALRTSLARLAPDTPRALLWLAIASPAFLWPLFVGHPTLLWAAGLLLALVARERGRWLLAGALLGLLSVKPSLGLLVPVALVAIGDWRTVAAATATTLALAAAATAIVGVEYWALYVEALREQTAYLAAPSDVGKITHLVGLQGRLVQLGVPGEIASAAHLAMAVGLAGLIAALWRCAPEAPALRIGALFAVTPMISPSIWLYDLSLMAVGAALLVAGGALRATPLGATLALSMYLSTFLVGRLDVPAAVVALPITALAAALLSRPLIRPARRLIAPVASD